MLCRAAQTQGVCLSLQLAEMVCEGDEEWGAVKPVAEQVFSSNRLLAGFGAAQSCGFPSRQQTCGVVGFTARWIKMAPLPAADF